MLYRLQRLTHCQQLVLLGIDMPVRALFSFRTTSSMPTLKALEGTGSTSKGLRIRRGPWILLSGLAVKLKGVCLEVARVPKSVHHLSCSTAYLVPDIALSLLVLCMKYILYYSPQLSFPSWRLYLLMKEEKRWKIVVYWDIGGRYRHASYDVRFEVISAFVISLHVFAFFSVIGFLADMI